MKRIVLLAIFVIGPSAGAQDLVITNARIIDGTGSVIEQGSLTVQGGEIVSVGVERDADTQATRLDANGMTAIPGMIDTHVHLSASPDMEHSARTFLELGFTTIADNAGRIDLLSALRDRIATQNSGPRILISGALVGPGNHPVGTICRSIQPSLCEDGIEEVTDPVEARTIVRRYAASGVDAVKSIYEDNPPGTIISDAVLLAAAQEAEAVGLPLIVHSPLTSDALRALELGADRMVHAPVLPVPDVVDIDELSQKLVEGSVPVATTAHIRAPLRDDSGALITHRGQPFSERDLPLIEEHLDKVRRLWNAGVTIAFGTDTLSPDPTADLRHEIETLSSILSPEEILTTLTRNAARYLGLDAEIGVLEAGKRADLVILDGDPLTDISAFDRVAVVIKDGRVVVDNR